jgi:hypothetical protein
MSARNPNHRGIEAFALAAFPDAIPFSVFQRFSFSAFPGRPSFRPAFQRVSNLFKATILPPIGIGRHRFARSRFTFQGLLDFRFRAFRFSGK